MTRLVERIRAQALRTPDHPAITSGADTISFETLEGASNHLARTLLDHAEPGSVAHFGPPGPAQAIALLAAQKAGRAFLAFDEETPADLLKERIEVAEVALITSIPDTLDQAHALGPKAVTVDTTGSADPAPHQISPDTISHIRFTSGSTGRSRGVCLTHGHTDRMTDVIERFLPANPDDNIALLGQFWPIVMLRAMSVGATLHCINFARIGLAETRARLQCAQITALFTYPQALRTILEDTTFPAIRHLHVSGDALATKDLRQFKAALAPGTTVHISFGSTEFPWIAAELHTTGQSDTFGTPPMGRPVFPQEVRLERKDGTPCPPGETGEIVVQSDDLPAGYLNDPDSTDQHFRLDTTPRRFRTGDMAFEDEGGIWHGRGRIDDMIKVRGANVWPGEVERVLATHPAIEDAAIAPARTAAGEIALAAFFTAQQPVTGKDLRLFLRARLPGPMMPSAFTQVSHLPKTETGKLQRSKLPQITLNPPQALAPEWPKGDTETTIAAIWHAMLGTDKIDRTTDFLDLGGDSLMAVEMLARVETAFGRRIPIDILSLEGGTIADLARWLDDKPTDNTPVLLREGGSGQLILFPVAGGHLSDYLRLIEVFRGPHEVLGLRPTGLSHRDEAESDMARLVATMLRALPPGDQPLDLLGFSFGALAAFEAARQIQDAGRAVGSLTLIDPPLDWQSRAPTLRFLFRCLRARDHERFVGGLRHLTGLVPPNRKMDAAHLKAALEYRPRPLKGVRTLIITSTQSDPTGAPWTDLTDGAAQVRPFAAKHNDLIRHPTVEAVSDVISDWLQG